MKFTQPISLILTATLTLAAAEPAKKPHPLDDSQAHVLKLDWLDLARELGDESEAGQDEAARLQAAAKRIETESRVARKSMRRVIILNEWREALDRWEDLQLELVCLWNGGGTLYHHMMARNAVETEEFLAVIADHLPLAENPLPGHTTLEIDRLLTKSKQRLAQAKATVKQNGQKSPPPIANLAQRLEEAHAALKSQFQFAGDDATIKLFLSHCTEPTDLWENP